MPSQYNNPGLLPENYLDFTSERIPTPLVGAGSLVPQTGGGFPSYESPSFDPTTQAPIVPGVGNVPGAPSAGSGRGYGTFLDTLKVGGQLGNLYLGYKGLEQSKEALRFNKAVTNRNLASQAQQINTQLEAQQRNRMLTSGRYRDDPAKFQADLDAYVKKARIEGSPIG